MFNLNSNPNKSAFAIFKPLKSRMLGLSCESQYARGHRKFCGTGFSNQWNGPVV